MTTSHSPSASGRSPWAEQIAERYAVRLPDDLTDWFNAGIWERRGTGEFSDPLAPAQLLAPHPEAIWPGLMPPDTLPLLGNRYGDWLCLRVGADSQVTEIVQWYHGGGDWIPWGATLAEAIAFDRFRHELPGHRQFYAVAAEAMYRPPNATPLHHWSSDHFPEPLGSMLRQSSSPDSEDLADRLLEAGVCEIAVRCEMALHALDSVLRRQLSPEIADELQIPWQSDALRWIFDARELPAASWPRLQARLRLPDGEAVEQDWRKAIVHASAVANARDDLGWALDLCGWAAERDSRPTEAIAYYQRALSASSFTDQSTRFRTHWYAESEGKFAAARLRGLLGPNASGEGPSDLADLSQRYLRQLLKSPAEERLAHVTQFWLRQADTAAQRSDWAEEYRMVYLAGWDLGTDSLASYGPLLQRLAEAAERAGQSARAAVARTHLQCLQTRFAQ